MKIRALVLLSTVLLAGCSHYASVKVKQPHWKPFTHANAGLTAIQTRLIEAQHQKSKPMKALGDWLDAASAASAQLQVTPGDPEALAAYNFAVARVVGTLGKNQLEPWKQPLSVPSPDGAFTLSHRKDPRPAWYPGLYDFTPSDQFDIDGKYVKEHVKRAGVGAPLVAVGKSTNLTARTDFSLPKVYYGVTAVLRFQGRRAELSFEDPLEKETTDFGGRKAALAADFSVPLAVMLASTDPKKLELSRLLRPEKYAETARIARLQPYDPNKTVVLVVHGLMDSPATWTPMINHLRGDPAIRANYQFWFYSYPSGYPYPYSASILRRELDAIESKFPLQQKMVVIGHSMGGCISRLLITDTGDDLWRKIFQKSPAETNIGQDSKALLSEALVFKSREEIGRVIFISAPLRGSNLASGWIGRLGTKLVKSPANLVSVGQDALKVMTFQGDDLRLKRIPDSVDTLAPNNRFVRAINTIPISPGFPHHVICGDRGKAGNKDKTKPIMSDGVVPYWSSHMPTALSEKVVPSGHSAHQNDEAILEVERILKLHAGGRNR